MVVFAVVVGAAWLGAFFRGVLPKHHLSDESKDIVKIGIGLIATLSALVLGLLVASAKSSFDTKAEEIKESAAKIICSTVTCGSLDPRPMKYATWSAESPQRTVKLDWSQRRSDRPESPQPG